MESTKSKAVIRESLSNEDGLYYDSLLCMAKALESFGPIKIDIDSTFAAEMERRANLLKQSNPAQPPHPE